MKGDAPLQSVRVERTVRVPAGLRLARYRKAPEFGPRVLFFSGGTALNGLSRRLTDLTHNSIHIITPFDSGGSSAQLREAFGVPAVGDMRSRLMALADRSVRGSKAVVELFSHRLPKDVNADDLHGRLDALVRGQDDLIAAVREPMRSLICNHLRFFRHAMPDGFDLGGASIGNLVLAGGLLNQRENIDSVIFMFSRLIEARGVVRPVDTGSYHLAVELEDGTTICGQHRMTGKEVAPITSPVRDLGLIDDLKTQRRVQINVRPEIIEFIASADLICYPMGSFYSSILANFLPHGVGEAIRLNDCPKVYVPSTGTDPEQLGMSLSTCVDRLIGYLRQSSVDPKTPARQLVTHVLLDSRSPAYRLPIDLPATTERGVQIIDVPLVPKGSQLLDPDRVLEILLSLA